MASPKLQLAAHLQSLDFTLAVFVEKCCESLLVAQWTDMVSSYRTVDAGLTEVVTTTTGEYRLCHHLEAQGTLSLLRRDEMVLA